MLMLCMSLATHAPEHAALEVDAAWAVEKPDAQAVQPGVAAVALPPADQLPAAHGAQPAPP